MNYTKRMLRLIAVGSLVSTSLHACTWINTNVNVPAGEDFVIDEAARACRCSAVNASQCATPADAARQQGCQWDAPNQVCVEVGRNDEIAGERLKLDQVLLQRQAEKCCGGTFTLAPDNSVVIQCPSTFAPKEPDCYAFCMKNYADAAGDTTKGLIKKYEWNDYNYDNGCSCMFNLPSGATMGLKSVGSENRVQPKRIPAHK